MRPTGMWLPLLFGAVLAAGQQAPSASTQKTPQATEAKQSSKAVPHKATHHRRSRSAARARRAELARKKGKRPEYRPQYSENSVEVINGDATRKVVFQDGQASASGKDQPKTMKKEPVPMKVEVLNGTMTDTQYFYGDAGSQEIARNQQVVVGVESSDTRTIGGNKHPVVTSVNSAENADAKPASSGGKRVTNSVVPRPKRPAYRPDVH